ncbi:hypothetical protein CXB51_008703 [Gossypium anomalum]|uniref:Uncharacterized protein n=1 Tax=Gossypium anomalum TaxID=47600 RepID=A0A8J5Z9P9_9ROSI|nr:hypothetical protein CXB51_008703 [Gossypium anomalum]
MTLFSVQQLEQPKPLISSKLEWTTKKVPNKDLDGWDFGDVKMRSKGILLDDDDFEIFEEDVKISSNGPFPDIFFSDHIHEILDQSMEQTIVVRLLGRSIGYRALVNRTHAL